MAKITLNDQVARKPAPATGQIELWDKALPGFGLRIACGGARTYVLMKRLNGKLLRRTVGKFPPLHATKDDRLAPGEYWTAEARAKARRMIEELALGIDPAAPKEPPKATTVPRTWGEVTKAFFEEPGKGGAANLKSRRELERKNTKELDEWKDRPIAEITKADIRAMIAAKRKVSASSANRLLSFIKQVFNYAAAEDIIEASPAASISKTDEASRDRVLSSEEMKRIWAGADKLGYPFGPLIKTLILTAQRRSEVAGLMWSEVNGNEWFLPDARTKRGKGHLVPLSPRAVAVLGEVPKFGDPPSLVFTTGKRKAAKGETVKPTDPAPVSGWSRMKTRLDKIIAEAAAEEADEPLDMKKHGLADWTLHDIRRSVATELSKAGVARLTISKVLNHAEGGITQIYDRYDSAAEKRKALEDWATRVERLCGLNVVNLGEARA